MNASGSRACSPLNCGLSGINNVLWPGGFRDVGELDRLRINNSWRRRPACRTHTEKRGSGNKEPGDVRGHRRPSLVKHPIDDEGDGAQEIRCLEGSAGFQPTHGDSQKGTKDGSSADPAGGFPQPWSGDTYSWIWGNA